MKIHILTTMLALTLTTGSFAQDLKTNTIGTDIAALAFGGVAGEYQKLINEGKNEIGIGGMLFSPDENATMTGGWAWYRIYKNGNGEGVFYGVGCAVGPFTWDYTPNGGTKETIEEMLIWAQAVIGKRWNMSSGLTISPYIGGAYMPGEVKASDGSFYEFPDGSLSDGGLQPAIGIQVGFMF